MAGKRRWLRRIGLVATRQVGATALLVVGLATGAAAAGPTTGLGVLPPRTGVLYGVSCPTVTRCMAVADVPVSGGTAPQVLRRNGARASWVRVDVPAGLSDLYDVACSSVTRCVAVGAADDANDSGAVVVTVDGGITWSTATVPSDASGLQGVACAGPLHCVAVGLGSGGGEALYSADGGTTWLSGNLPPGWSGGLSRVACPGPIDCVAVGDGVVVSTDGGVSWTAGRLPAATPDLAAVTCASTTRCVGVSSGQSSPWGGAGTGSAVVSTDGGSTWASARLPHPLFGLSAVSCPSLRRCVALGTGEAVASGTGGRTWTRGRLGNPAAVLNDGVCPTVRICVAVGSNGPDSRVGTVVVSQDAGRTWR